MNDPVADVDPNWPWLRWCYLIGAGAAVLIVAIAALERLGRWLWVHAVRHLSP
jgi:hypothetical protein